MVNSLFTSCKQAVFLIFDFDESKILVLIKIFFVLDKINFCLRVTLNRFPCFCAAAKKLPKQTEKLL